MEKISELKSNKLTFNDVEIGNQYIWLDKYIVTVADKKSPAEIAVYSDLPYYAWCVPLITLSKVE